MIKAIIFDFGDVLSVPGNTMNAFKKIEHKLNISADEAFAKVFDSNEIRKLLRGKITLNEFHELMANWFGIDVETIAKFQNEIDSNMRIDEDILKIVGKLNKNYKLAILSDHIKGVFDSYVDKFKLTNYFDVILCSAHEGLLKADVDIFHILLRKINNKPEECVFIDDRNTNIEVAKSLGFKTIHFKDVNHLEDELKKLGVKF